MEPYSPETGTPLEVHHDPHLPRHLDRTSRWLDYHCDLAAGRNRCTEWHGSHVLPLIDAASPAVLPHPYRQALRLSGDATLKPFTGRRAFPRPPLHSSVCLPVVPA